MSIERILGHTVWKPTTRAIISEGGYAVCLICLHVILIHTQNELFDYK